MESKQTVEARQNAIKELVKKLAISDQKQLVELLMSHHQIETNQTVVSRDLRKLGIVKREIKGVLSYDLPDIDVTAEILKLALVDISHNETMIVIKTHPALADFVGDCVDEHDDLDVLGCLGGENVVFVTPKSIKNIAETYKKICEKFHFKKKGNL